MTSMQTLLYILGTDLRYCLKRLLRKPQNLLIPAFLLAAAISLNTTVITVTKAILLKPLPFKDPERLLLVGARRLESNMSYPISPADFWDWEESGTFSEIAAVANTHPAVLLGGRAEYPSLARVTVTTAGLFPMLGVVPIWGRSFTSDEQTAGEPVIMVSYETATHLLGSKREIVNSFVRLDGVEYKVVGVFPPGFEFYTKTDVWKLINPSRGDRSRRSLGVIAKLPINLSLAAAQSRMDAVARRLANTFVDTNRGFEATVLTPLRDRFVYSVRESLEILSGVAVIFLLLACGSLVSMQMARSESQQRNAAIMTSIGANVWQTSIYLLSDSFVWSGLGCFLGLAGSVVALRILRHGTLALPRQAEIQLDASAFIIFGGVTALTVALCAILPLFAVSRFDLSTVLKQRVVSSSPSWRLLSSLGVLLVLQAAIAVISASSMAVLVRSFIAIHSIDLGFHPANVVTVEFKSPRDPVNSSPSQVAVLLQLMDHLSAIPGVQAVGATNSLPLLGQSHNYPFSILGKEISKTVTVQYRFITPRYLDIIGVPLLKGRNIERTDGAATSPVCLVNAAMAQQYWPKEEALGSYVQFPDKLIRGAPWLKVVGVYGSFRQVQFTEPAYPEISIPITQYPGVSEMNIVVKTGLSLSSLTPVVQKALEQSASNLPRTKLARLTDLLGASQATNNLVSGLITVYAMLCLVLATLSTYSIVSFAVDSRRRDMALRIALGASPEDIRWFVMRHGGQLTATGLIVGFAGALAARQIMSNNFVNLMSFTFSDIVIILACVGIVLELACLMPAIRASRVDPIEVLRDC